MKDFWKCPPHLLPPTRHTHTIPTPLPGSRSERPCGGTRFHRGKKVSSFLLIKLPSSHSEQTAPFQNNPKIENQGQARMMPSSFVARLLVAVAGAAVVSAYKDDSYYMPGSGNPNVKEKMYWKDADNVLQDLSQFSELYVEFSHCAWTWMQMEDEGNDVDENDYWYMGKVPPMGANVAYSLYGSLKGQSFSGCNEKTFINSFYTNTGFQDFAQAMYYAGQSGFSSYAYDDDSSGGISAGCGGGYGVGCDATYGFAVHTYSTDTCDPAWVNGVSDPLYDLNSAFESSACVKIYDSSSYSGYSSGTALQLLDYSSACFYQNFYSPDGECPDPYGKIKYYRQNFANGLSREKRSQPYEIYTHEVKKGQTLVVVGAFLIMVASVMIWRENRKLKTAQKHNFDGPAGADGLVWSTGEQPEPATFTPPTQVETPKSTAPAPATYQAPSPPQSSPSAPTDPFVSTAPPSQRQPQAGFQQIHPSPLASRDESVVSYQAPDPTPFTTGANLSLLAGAVATSPSADGSAGVAATATPSEEKKLDEPTSASSDAGEDIAPTPSKEDSTFLMEEGVVNDESVPATASKDSAFLMEEASGSIGPAASKESASKDSTPHLMDALMTTAASKESVVSKDTVDSSVKLDQMLSDKIDAALSSSKD